MAAGRPKKRASRQSASSTNNQSIVDNTASPSTPQRSPIKKRKAGLNAQQKQALIDNLQLEITERARRLRAQCHLQAQGMRSRIEIRVNRIPTALRKIKMGDLLLKCIEDEQKKAAATRPPPVPAKDVLYRSSPPKHVRDAPVSRPARAQKRTSDQYLDGKENEVENMENAKKKPRANHGTDAAPVRPGQVLSPTSSNSRLANRDRPISPIKSQIARPGSPLKGTLSRSAAATSVLSSMVEKAKATRNGAARKLTTASTVSSSSSGTTATTRTRRAAAPTTTRAPPSRPATRTARRISDNSETSEGSTGTVVRKTAAAKPTAAATKRTVMGSIRKGVAGVAAKKTASKATAPAPAPTTSTGRTLRKRG